MAKKIIQITFQLVIWNVTYKQEESCVIFTHMSEGLLVLEIKKKYSKIDSIDHLYMVLK